LNTKIIRVGIIAILILSMAACTNSTKPTTKVAIEQIQQDVVALDFIKSKFEKVVSIKVNSQPVQGTQALVVADMTYDNGEALITGEVIINYEWNKKEWKAVNAQFSYKSVKVKFEAKEKDVLEAATEIETINTRYQANAFSDSPVLVSKELDLNNGLANYVVTRSSSTDGWNAVTTYKIGAKYDYLVGWVFEIKDWSYRETMNWAGTWKLVWGSEANETQYSPNEAMTIVIAGEVEITNNMAGNEIVTRALSVSFKRERNPYIIPATISKDYEKDGLYSTRFINVKYGNQANDEFNLELRFEGTSSDTMAKIVSKSYDGNFGVVTKTK